MFREIFLTEIYPRYFEHLKHPDVDPDVYFIGGNQALARVSASAFCIMI